MKTQIKKHGNSNVLVLSPEFMKYHGAQIGDWIDMSDCIIISDLLKKVKEDELE